MRRQAWWITILLQALVLLGTSGCQTQEPWFVCPLENEIDQLDEPSPNDDSGTVPVYYITIYEPSYGERYFEFPIHTGHTVRDALEELVAPSTYPSLDISLRRHVGNQAGQVYVVNKPDIIDVNGKQETNFVLSPGDEIYIAKGMDDSSRHKTRARDDRVLGIEICGHETAP